jgi:hypothetical protein
MRDDAAAHLAGDGVLHVDREAAVAPFRRPELEAADQIEMIPRRLEPPRHQIGHRRPAVRIDARAVAGGLTERPYALERIDRVRARRREHDRCNAERQREMTAQRCPLHRVHGADY